MSPLTAVLLAGAAFAAIYGTALVVAGAMLREAEAARVERDLEAKGLIAPAPRGDVDDLTVELARLRFLRDAKDRNRPIGTGWGERP